MNADHVLWVLCRWKDGTLEPRRFPPMTAQAAIRHAVAAFTLPEVVAVCVQAPDGSYPFWLDVDCLHPASEPPDPDRPRGDPGRGE